MGRLQKELMPRFCNPFNCARYLKAEGGGYFSHHGHSLVKVPLDLSLLCTGLLYCRVWPIYVGQALIKEALHPGGCDTAVLDDDPLKGQSHEMGAACR